MESLPRSEKAVSNSILMHMDFEGNEIKVSVGVINRCLNNYVHIVYMTYFPTNKKQYLSAIVEIHKEQLVLTASDGGQLTLQVSLSMRPKKEDFTVISPVSENIFIRLDSTSVIVHSTETKAIKCNEQYYLLCYLQVQHNAT